jgi:type II secretory pathway component PulJ
MRKQRGFGLLEALVALALISSIGIALLAWVQQNLDILQRLRGHYQEQEARRLVQDWSAALNPMQQPEGEVTMGETRIVWKAEQQGAPTSQSGYPMGIGLYDLAMFRVVVTVYRGRAATPWVQEELTRLGWRQARSVRSGPF